MQLPLRIIESLLHGLLKRIAISSIIPMLGTYDFAKELEYQVQIGSNMIPEYPCKSLAQTHYELKKSLGIHGSAWHSMSAAAVQYIRDHFFIGIDTEKCLGAAWTGLNTKAGDLLTFKIKGANAELPASYAPTKLFTTINSENVLEIGITGASVYD